MNAVDGLVLAAYASLLLELVVFPIPSEASSWQLLASRGEQAQGMQPTGELALARRRATSVKLLSYLLPTALGVALFLVPLASMFVAPLRELLTSPPLPAASWTGVALIAIGRTITFTSVLQLRASRRAPRGLAHGLFRWSRNPGLVGMYGFYAGLCLVCLSPYMALGFPLYVANMHRRVRMEESHLEQRLGESWRAYRGAVPRYAPLPGLR